MNRDVEILAPAGSMECLRAAVAAGADAIYLGGTKFGARAYAQNLSEEDLVQAIEYVHIHGRKIYMTVNTLLKDRELNELYAYLLPYYKAGLDGVIVQDIGAVKFIGEYFPEMPVHASTQMTITNTLGADFLKRYGITRVVPARELSLKEIRDMKKQTGLEMECFVHGALCYCYSGQCLLSSMIGGRSGNRGQCAQPCRLPYQTEGKKPADLMSLKDLCTIDILPELIDAGIDSFKIEGRMKTALYVATVARTYRKAIDDCPPWSLYKMFMGITWLLSLSALIKGGVPISVALTSLRKDSNRYLRERIDRAMDFIKNGDNLGQALSKSKLNFPDKEIVADLRIYAELDNFEEALDRLANDWLDESAEAVEQKASILNMVAMFAISGIIAWAVFGVFEMQDQITSAMG